MLLGDQAFCGDEEHARTTGVTVARYERTQPHRINRFKAAGFMFYFDEKVNRAWRTQGLGEWWIVSSEKAACNRPPGISGAA